MVKKNLRPYQEKAISNIEKELENGKARQLLVMSMGLGKTFCAVKAEEKLQSKKTIWVTDDERLLEQSAMAFIRDKFDDEKANFIEKVGFLDYCRGGGTFSDNGYKMSVIKADLFDTTGNVVFASAQTLWRRLERLDPEMFDVMIIDEAHCFGSKRLYQGVDFFTPRLRLGLSGTPFRNDGVMMGDMFDCIPFEYDMYNGIKDGWLCELDSVRIKTNVNLDKVHTLAGEFNQSELSNEINTLARNNLIAESYLQYAAGKQAIGFGVDIKHCLDLAEAFKSYGINSVAISSDDERTGDSASKIKLYKEKKIDVIWNVNMLSKGFDHADTGCSIAAAPVKSLVRYLQGPAGRISRLKSPEYVEKFGQKGTIIDVVDVTSRHSLVNAWELDKKKPLEQRTFITSETKKNLLFEINKRKVKLEHTRDKDEQVSLLSLPIVKISNSWKMKEPATPAQLAWIAREGHDIVNNVYTKFMCSEIISKLPASDAQIWTLKNKGYDVSNGVTVAEAKLAFDEINGVTTRKVQAPPPPPVVINNNSIKSNPFLDLN